MRLFYSPDYVASQYAFDTTRKAGWIVDSLRDRPITGLELCAPEPLTETQLCTVHDPAYVAAVHTGEPRYLAESQGFAWDPALWRMVVASNGGVVAAALAARSDGVAGSLSSGLHHARRSRGAGFCTFNGLALAARAVLDAGARTVLLLDLDAHCGGGTHALIEGDERIWQLDIAVSRFDHYQPTGRNTLDLVRSAADYLPTVTSRLHACLETAPPFDLCLYNAGMDPHVGSAIDGLEGITHELLAERERVVFDWCRQRGIPIAFVLAGGYAGPRLTRAELVELHRCTLLAASGGQAGDVSR